MYTKVSGLYVAPQTLSGFGNVSNDRFGDAVALSTDGGTVVTLHGTNLGSVTAVSFGGVPATTFTGAATSLTVTAPAHAAGTVDITITTATQSATIHGYTYLDAGSIAPQPQPGGHLPAGNVISGGIAPMAQPGRR